MHELGIVMELLDVVTERSKGAKVSRIVVEVGTLTAVMPEAMQFSFEVAREGTIAEAASLEIVATEGEDIRIREMEVG